MLELKEIDHEVVDLLPGLHPLFLRAAGFRRGTVPALRIRRRQGPDLAANLALPRPATRPSPASFRPTPQRSARSRTRRRGGRRLFSRCPGGCFAGRRSDTPSFAAGSPSARGCRFRAWRRSSTRRSPVASLGPSARPMSGSAPTSPSCRRCSIESTSWIAEGTIGGAEVERGRLPDRELGAGAARLRGPSSRWSRNRPVRRARDAALRRLPEPDSLRLPRGLPAPAG